MTRIGDGVGTPGRQVGGYSIDGHADPLQPINDRVEQSYRQPMRFLLSQAGANGTDRTAEPVSPLTDWRGSPGDLRNAGQR